MKIENGTRHLNLSIKHTLNIISDTSVYLVFVYCPSFGGLSNFFFDLPTSA